MDVIKFQKVKDNHRVLSTAHNVLFFHKNIKFLTIRPHGGTFAGMYKTFSNQDFLSMFSELIHSTFSHIPYIGSIEKNKDIGYHCHLMVDCSTKHLNNLKDLNLSKFDVLHKFNLKQYAWMVSKPTQDKLRGVIYFLGYHNNPLCKHNLEQKKSYFHNITNIKEELLTQPNENIKQYIEFTQELKVVNSPKENNIKPKSLFINMPKASTTVIEDLGINIVK